MRTATADVMVTLQAHKEMALEDCLEYIGDDELVEITPENIRLRKSDLNRKIFGQRNRINMIMIVVTEGRLYHKAPET